MQKKILFVSPLYPSVENPEYCIFIEQQALFLKKLGNSVDVIVPRYVNSVDLKISKTIISGLTVIYVDFPVFYKSLISSLSIKRFVSFISTKVDFLNYNLISLHMFNEHMLKAFIDIKKTYNLKLVVHYHGLNVFYSSKVSKVKEILQYRGNNIYKRLLREVDAIVGVSNKVQLEVKEIININKIVTIYNGVDTELFYPLPIDVKRDQISILCVGNLIITKGQKYLIKAFAELLKRYPNKKIILNIVGKGEMLQSLVDLTTALGIEDKVTFHGNLHYNKVASIMRDADIFILPSYYEALGCVYLEAMASKVVTIGCRGQGIDEIIKHGENGYLLKGQSTDSILNILDYLINNENERKKIANNGYRVVKENYTWENSARKLDQLYEELL